MSNYVLVDKGCLQMALNVLERAGKQEVCDALRDSCKASKTPLEENAQEMCEVLEKIKKAQETIKSEVKLCDFLFHLRKDMLKVLKKVKGGG